MNITLSIIHMITTQCLMSEHSSDSISNRLAQPGKNTLQKKYITRLEGHNNIDQLCVRENLLTDLPESWPYKESLHNRSRLINYGDKITAVMYQPKTQKEVYILSRPLKLQPTADHSITPQHTPREEDLPPLPSILEAQEIYQCTYKELYFLPEPSEKNVYPYRLTKQTLVQHSSILAQHRQNTSWELATL